MQAFIPLSYDLWFLEACIASCLALQNHIQPSVASLSIFLSMAAHVSTALMHWSKHWHTLDVGFPRGHEPLELGKSLKFGKDHRHITRTPLFLLIIDDGFTSVVPPTDS
jgi:hypothetical protein